MLVSARILHDDAVGFVPYQTHLPVMIHELTTSESAAPTDITRHVEQICVDAVTPILPQNQSSSWCGVEFINSQTITTSFSADPIACFCDPLELESVVC